MSPTMLRLAPQVFVAASRLAGGATPSATEERQAARALLRRLLQPIAGRFGSAYVLAAHASGQPYLPERPDLTVSLSHSGGWVGAAVHTGGGRVGIDVQAAVAPSPGLVRRCCTPAGQTALAGLAEPARALEFAWVWSVQEACVKATGRGIAGLPWTVPVEVGQAAGAWRGLDWQALRDWLPVPISCAHSRPEWTEAAA